MTPPLGPGLSRERIQQLPPQRTSLRIAQVSPLTESVPPATYGGTERVVSYLTEELVRQGHHVTLFASGDSVTSAELVPCCPRSLRQSEVPCDSLAWHLMQIEMVARRADEFDVIHFHTEYLHLPTFTRLQVPYITTFHGRLDLPELTSIYRMFPGMPAVSISDAQRQPLEGPDWVATIYHGLPDVLEAPRSTGEHLTFLGRICPEKRVDRAIEIAIANDLPLVIAAKIDRADREYFDQKIARLLDHPLVTFVGEIGEADKRDILRNTLALLFPIDWPEPFGMVLPEALSHGVPIVAFRHGSVPEIVEDGETGYIVDTVEDAIAAVRKAASLDPARCRRAFMERFRSTRMAEEYVREYQRQIEAGLWSEGLQVAS